MLCHYPSEWWEDPGEFVDESWNDISGLAQIRVVPPAEKRSSELLPIVKVRTDRMSQRCFSHSRRAEQPVCITLEVIVLI